MSDFSAFADHWHTHEFDLTLQPQGFGVAVYRTQLWCDVAQPPCDMMIDDKVLDGGVSLIGFVSIVGDTAFGYVSATSDPAVLPLGPVTLTLGDGDIAILQAGATTISLCGSVALQTADQSGSADCGA